MLRILVLAAALLALAGCATPPPISSNPVQTAANAVAATPLGGTVVQGLKDAEFNLDSAISIGVLDKTDPADACVHSSLVAIGQESGQTPPVPVQTFTPKVSDLISAGSVAYILAHQAKQVAAAGGLALPPSCEQIVGEFVLKGVNAPANAVISGVIGALP
jgi:hypothetical protein